MRGLVVLAAAWVAGPAGPALAAPPSANAELAAAAFVARKAPVERTVEQPLSRAGGREVYLYAGAVDSRWSTKDEPRPSSSFVNTKLGVGWRRAGLETSLGYQVVKRSPATDGQRPRKTSMLGVNLKYRPGF